MLEASLQRLLAEIDDDAVVLDVGGGAKPFPRADWVIDALGYDERADLGVSLGTGTRSDRERFGADTWVQRDICEHEPWPFSDGQFDFVVCSHTLEDIRDPIWACHEIARVGKAGYIEIPSRLEEQTYGIQGPWTGWTHHRWLIDIDQDNAQIDFVHKPHLLNGRENARFPTAFFALLSAEERVQTLWWRESFGFRERLFWDFVDFDAYVDGFVEAELARRGLSRGELSPTWRARLGRLRRRATRTAGG